MYSSTLPSTSTLNEGGWSTPRPGRFTPGKEPVSVVEEAGWALGLVWTGAENLASTRIRSPERPARSESLYRLSYHGYHLYWCIFRNCALKIQVSLKSDKNNRYFTWRPIYVYDNISLNSQNKMFHTSIIEKIKIHFLCLIPFFDENLTV